MQVNTFQYIRHAWVNKAYAVENTSRAQLLLIFGDKELIANEDLYITLKMNSNSHIL
jgi:hypothetical protein